MILSVLTPSRNYDQFLPRALASVETISRMLRDHGILVEHIVVDGCSSDNTRALLKESPSHVRWISEPDAGQSDALNKALSIARGQWIAWLNADEFYLPGFASLVEECLASDTSDVTFSEALYVDESGAPIRVVRQHKFSSFVLRNIGCYLPSCTAVIRRSVLDRYAPNVWDLSLTNVMDWDLWLRLQADGAIFRFRSGPVAAYRVHPEQATAEPLSWKSDEHRILRNRHSLPSTAVEFWSLRVIAYGHRLILKTWRRLFGDAP